MIAYVEAHYTDDQEMNRLCTPVILADTPSEWMQSFVGNMINMRAWSQEKGLNAWLYENRLEPMAKMAREAVQSDPSKAKTIDRIRTFAQPAVLNMMSMLSQSA